MKKFNLRLRSWKLFSAIARWSWAVELPPDSFSYGHKVSVRSAAIESAMAMERGGSDLTWISKAIHATLFYRHSAQKSGPVVVARCWQALQGG